MRFVVSGEFTRNRLLQVIVVLFVVYVALLWVTNAVLYFQKMSLSPSSVVDYYLGSEERFLQPRSFQGMVEISHFHLFAMGLLLMTLTHLMLFVPLSWNVKAIFVIVPLILPIALQFGVDPVHLGIIFIANLELGYLTPPVGLNLFVSSYRFNTSVIHVARATVPMLLVLAIAVLLITYWPWLTTGLAGTIQ